MSDLKLVWNEFRYQRRSFRRDPQAMFFAIGLPLRQPDALNNFLAKLYDPASPNYHHYLTPDQFTQLFAPPPDQVQQVTAYLQSQGFTVTGIAPNNRILDATGSVGQVQQSFHVQINSYRLGNHTFYANATAPSLPASIGQLISSIGGLDNSVQYHPHYQRQVKAGSAAATGATGLGPKDLARAYDATPLQANGIEGDNQTIALFELDGYQPGDINAYFQNYGITPPTISKVLVDNVSGNAGQGAVEAELDIEVTAAMAPHANQIVYEGPNTTQGLNDSYNKIVTDNKAQIASISWGLCETYSGSAELQLLDTIFKQGAAQGISFFAAAGDSGAYDCQDTNLAVDSPASDPYVTGVGATSLQLNAGAYVSESVWSDASQLQHGPKGVGSGGGLSSVFKQPAWQSGSGTQSQYTNGYREVPDVSAVGDPKTGYSVYCTVTNAGCPPTGWITIGGTSAAAPFWASSLLLINQYLLAHNAGVIGHANIALYHVLSTQQPYPAFHDVATGNNLYFPATTSYDLASGIGSPDLYNLARDLAASVSGSIPTPSPTTIPSPTPSPTSPPSPTPSPTLPPALIKNSDFENGQTPWQEASSQGYQIIDTTNAYTGQSSAYLCGYMGCNDRIWQTFIVPTSYTKIIVTYWWYSDTSKNTNQCQDTFNSRLQNTNGGLIRNLQQSCNTDATNIWVQESFDVSGDVSAYKGKSVTLLFHGTNAQGQYETSDFFVDDAVVTVA